MKKHLIKKTALFIAMLVMGLTLHAQNSKTASLSLSQDYSNLLWNQFIQKVESDFPLHFYFDPKDIPNIKISFKTPNNKLEAILNSHFLPLNIFVSFDDFGNIFLSKGSPVKTELATHFFKSETIPKNENTAINPDKFIQTTAAYSNETAIIGSKELGVNKQFATLRGKLTNHLTGKALPGLSIHDLTTGQNLISDANGNYQIKLRIGTHLLKIQGVNTSDKQIKVDLRSDGVLNLALEDKIVILKDVVVNADIDNPLEGTKMGFDKVSTKKTKKIPLIFGEKDVLKIALLLPGVQSLGEGSAGYNVRGSSSDQNLFYINHLPLYNTSHLAGFFSAFNADAISSFSMYKSNIPIEYGGRLSSFFEINAKEGSKKKFTARGGIGPITGRITIEGPLKKDKSSFLIGLRSTYSNWVLNFVKDPIIKNSKAQFADAVGNFSIYLNENNRLNLFTYASYDHMNIFTQSKYNYQNAGASLSWNHFFENKNKFELSFANSGYYFNEENSQISATAYKNNNNLNHSELKAIYFFKVKQNHALKIGFNSTFYQIDRGIYNPLTDSSFINTLNLGKEKGMENAFFLSDDWKLSPSLIFSAGLRLNIFTYFGEQDVNHYRTGLPFNDDNLIESLHYANWEAIKTYSGLDFRFAVNHLITDNISVKAAYNRLHQYIYILNNSIAVSPNYRWKLSDYNTKPIVGDQLSLGIYTKFKQNTYAINLEAYYKFSQNVVELKNGANLLFNKNTEQAILQGNLDAYGIEFMLKKNKGHLTGWINYTYSKSQVYVDSPYEENRINFGNPYPSNYDKPHALNLVANYDFSRRISLSSNLVYSTGRPITYPTSIYYYDGIPSLNYSDRNAYRIPDYFRVDLSLNIEGNLLKRKLGHGTYALSVYNILGRKNAYSVYYKENSGQIKAYKLSIFGAPIFSVSYNFKLGNYASE